MRVTVIMMTVMVVVGGGGACGASDGGGECGGWWAGGGTGVAAPPSDAWRGAVAACQRAPACPHATACDDPRWAGLADWALDEIATCFAGPCEERAACISATMPPIECGRDP
ncbi:MAG: hypothetical protein K8M05_41070 [Deltaproteobacteria bacterium]|nr:hypothetical protein [Kofleriaceae bacterium]